MNANDIRAVARENGWREEASGIPGPPKTDSTCNLLPIAAPNPIIQDNAYLTRVAESDGSFDTCHSGFREVPTGQARFVERAFRWKRPTEAWAGISRLCFVWPLSFQRPVFQEYQG